MHLRRIIANPFGLAILAFVMSSGAQSPKPEYGIREDQARTGSMIRRYEVSGSVLPINKRYGEFTAEEKASLNGYYEHMEPGDEPPFPAEGLKSIYDAVRKAQAKLLVKGDLILLATISSTGEVTQVKAIGSPSKEMTNFAASVLLLTKFKPAVCQGLPCSMQFPFAYNFRLD